MARFGRLSIRSAYRPAGVNDCGNRNRLNCGRNHRPRADRSSTGASCRGYPHGV